MVTRESMGLDLEPYFDYGKIKDVLAKAALVTGLLFYFGFVVLLMLLTFEQAEAKVIVYGSQVEEIRIKHGTPTIFRFPKAVQTITGAGRLQIKPANASDPSYTVLAVTPRFTNGVNDVIFFLTDKSVVRAKVIVSPNDPAADGLYDFKSREVGENPESENAPMLSEVELMKAMIRDANVSGYKVQRFSRDFPLKIASAKAELLRIYSGTPFNGYVFKITNTSWRKLVDIDVRSISVGRSDAAILSQSDEAKLYPKGKGPHETFLRVVAKNTASSSDVILAMEAEEPTPNSKKGE